MESLVIREKLTHQHPSNTAWQRDLAVTYANIGAVQNAQGDLTNASKAYAASLAIREKLVSHDPENAEWQRDLAVSYADIGDLESAQGDIDAALEVVPGQLRCS